MVSPYRWLNWDGNGNDDLVRFDLTRQRELCATQRTLVNVTLDMDPVPTTPHLNNRSHERLETDWTLVHLLTYTYKNRPGKSEGLDDGDPEEHGPVCPGCTVARRVHHLVNVRQCCIQIKHGSDRDGVREHLDSLDVPEEDGQLEQGRSDIKGFHVCPTPILGARTPVLETLDPRQGSQKEYKVHEGQPLHYV